MAGHMTMQESAIATGAVELMAVDIQCVMQALAETVKHFHTKLVTTLSKAKITGAEHVEFEDENALEAAKKIIMMAIENYKNRDPKRYLYPVAQRLILLLVLAMKRLNICWVADSGRATGL